MKINGKEVQLGDLNKATAAMDDPTLNAAINILAKLPSGFDKKNEQTPRLDVTPGTPGIDSDKEGAAAFNLWQSDNNNTAALERAISDFKAAIEKIKSTPEKSPPLEKDPALAEYLYFYGYACQQAKHSEEAINAFTEAASIYKNAGNHAQQEYNSLSHLHDAMWDEIQKKQSATPAKGAGLANDLESEKSISDLHERLKGVRQEIVKLYFDQRGEPIAHNAYPIAQGEMGLSSHKLMGTDNVEDCVCVMLHDPQTKRTAIAHVDAYTVMKSLTVALNRMGVDKNTPIEVRLLGAQFKDDVDYSRNNVKRVLGFLQDWNVDIISSQLFDEKQPRVVVVDPQTFNITEEVPGIKAATGYLSNGRPMLDRAGVQHALLLAFDLDKSDQRAPTLLHNEEIKVLNKWLIDKSEDPKIRDQKSEDKINKWFKSAWPPNGPDDYGMLFQYAVDFRDAYLQSIQQIEAKLDGKIQKLKESGITVSEANRKHVMDIIEGRSIHIGHNAEIANQSLVDCIEKDLFQVDASGKKYEFHPEKLENIIFPVQPYNVIAAHEEKARLAEALKKNSNVPAYQQHVELNPSDLQTPLPVPGRQALTGVRGVNT